MRCIQERIEEVMKKMPSLENIMIRVENRPDLYPWSNTFFVVDGIFVVHDIKYLNQKDFHIAVTNETTPLRNFDARERDSRLGVYLERKEDGNFFKLATPTIPYIRIGKIGLADYYGGPRRSSHCFVNLIGCEQIEFGYCDEYNREEKEVLEDSGNGLVNPLIGQQRRYTVELWKLMQDIRVVRQS